MLVRFASPTSRPSAVGALTRADLFVRRVALQWRRLSDPDRRRGVPTLVACSGGADSTAMLLALALATRDLAAAFIIHDLRPREEELADARAVEGLCEHLRIPFLLGEVTSVGGNAEGLSRTRRYELLARMASDRGMHCVASAHHADDQLESLVMALLRGSGPAGLRGIAPTRPLTKAVTLIRPMLHSTREDAQRACRRAGVEWCEDHTNTDTRRLRAALRTGPLAELVRLRPGAPRRAAETAQLMREAHALVQREARQLVRAEHTWRRDELRDQPAIVIGAALRAAAADSLRGSGADRLSHRLVSDAVRAIRDDKTDQRRFTWPGQIAITVTAHDVRLQRH